MLEESDHSAYEQALSCLARRPYSVWELQQRLRQKGASLTCIERVTARCQELGYLDDAAFALSRARYRLHHGRYGPRWIRAELRSLHVDEGTIEQALAELLAEQEELFWARQALCKRFGEVDEQFWQAAGSDRRQKERCYAYLARRGFDDEVIWQLIR